MTWVEVKMTERGSRKERYMVAATRGDKAELK